MRLRNIPGSGEILVASPYVVKDPRRLRGDWKSCWGNACPLHLEIGMGKGRFLMGMAGKNPGVNYLGMEKYTSVLLRAVQKMEREPLPNLRFLLMDAKEIREVFGPGEVERIYLNFSDPWPKDRHAARRLPSRRFLGRFAGVLALGGQLEFKTDNPALFEFALEELEPAGWSLLAATRDLHRDETMNRDNVMTEYEEKFSALGRPIYKCVIQPRP